MEKLPRLIRQSKPRCPPERGFTRFFRHLPETLILVISFFDLVGELTFGETLVKGFAKVNFSSLFREESGGRGKRGHVRALGLHGMAGYGRNTPEQGNVAYLRFCCPWGKTVKASLGTS